VTLWSTAVVKPKKRGIKMTTESSTKSKIPPKMAKSVVDLEKVRDLAAATLIKNLKNVRDMEVIKVARTEAGGWETAVEISADRSFTKSFGVKKPNVLDNHVYEVIIDENFEVESYARIKYQSLEDEEV